MRDRKKEEYHVFLTEDTIRGMMLEVARHPRKECIVQMPGVRIDNQFYFDRVADSGINAVYEYAMCEKDHTYIDHLSTRIAEYYDFPVKRLTVSQVHKHPPKIDRFSTGDGPANIKLAQQFGGVVNGLILVDPEFRLKFWYIDEEGKEMEVMYSVDEEAVRAVMPKKDLNRLRKEIEAKEARLLTRCRKNTEKKSGKEKLINEAVEQIRKKEVSFY